MARLVRRELARLAAGAQGAYFVLSGAWPLVWMDGFLAVTGPKEDLWLVRTVGLLAIAIGLPLLAAARRGAVPPEARLLGATSAAAFLVVDVVGYATGTLLWTYLLDAVAEAALLAVWVLLWCRARA